MEHECRAIVRVFNERRLEQAPPRRSANLEADTLVTQVESVPIVAVLPPQSAKS